MLHGRRDYQWVQDRRPTGGIPDDEPVMLFRAQDKHLPKVLSYYLLLLGKDENAGIDIIQSVAEHIRAVQQWQREHGCKTPDLV